MKEKKFIFLFNRNEELKKLCIYLVNNKREYIDYVDSIYYDVAGNSLITNMWDYPHVMEHGKIKSPEFFKAFIRELRKYVKSFSVSVNRRCAVEFLEREQNTLGIKVTLKSNKETQWIFV